MQSLRTSRRRRGNTILETALVFVPTFAMMFGIMDFSVALFLRSTFQFACREGVRYAVTYQTMAGLGQDASIKSVVQTSSMGFLSGADGAAKIQIRYYTPDTFTLTAQNLPGNIIEVSVENYQWGWMVPLMRSATPLSMTARAADLMESLPGGTQPPAR
ncbi:MAG: pilus assembly protein [Acidobacteria bacterium]|nr:pilus assembly protein [Acidobacteriota bacterium]